MSTARGYATDTTVPVGRTRDEVERQLLRYGATGTMFGQDQDAAAVAFVLRGRHIRFTIPMPQPADFQLTPTRQKRTKDAAERAWQQAVRARWRALGLIIRAKLEAVDAGVTSLDDEFLAQLVMPGGQTVGQKVRPQLVAALQSDATPALLPGGER